MALRIEDSVRPTDQLHFVADADHSAISSRVNVSGYQIGPVSVVVKPYAYKATHGDPRLSKGYQEKHSQFIYGLPIKRDGVGFFRKVFQGLFAAVAIAFLVFFFKPTGVDPRFGLGVGAFFAEIVNCYITGNSCRTPASCRWPTSSTVSGWRPSFSRSCNPHLALRI